MMFFFAISFAPLGSLSGQLVFVISNLIDGSSFTEALANAYMAQFEVRSPETGALLYEFPLNR
tara:strand:- start:591 stop:779 length:189 start_codon:yes stop_codon:yes gene_type:complete